MSKKRDTSRILSGGLAGAGTGAAIGSVVPGIGTAIGTGVGGLIGGFGSFLSGRADDEDFDNDPEVIAMRRREKGLSMFRANLGRAFRARQQPANFGEMLNGQA